MRKIHFIGIGGIGVSALARYYQNSGFSVSGSDTSNGEVVELLIKEGISVCVGPQVAENIPTDVNKIIYTIAVREDNEEFAEAKKRQKDGGVELLSYPQALGEMTKNKKTISICGTHGKTTTTALVYHALRNAGINISMIVGSLIDVDGKKTNYIGGDSDWIVIESCEYRRSFLNYNPEIILVTNIDNDHLDYFKDEEDIRSAFQEFVDKLKSHTSSGLCLDSFKVAKKALILHQNENFLQVAENVEKIICEDFVNEREIKLFVPGQHNRKNAQLVVALGEFLKLDKQKVLEGLQNFKGTWRRQEYKGNFFGAEFYDDYGHHPTEVKATLAAFREKFKDKKIWAIFQPHLFSRTKLLFSDFVNSFNDADEVVLLPIYPSREKFDETINSDMVVEEMKKKGKKATLVQKENLKKYLEKNILAGEVVITLGAGNIYDIYHELETDVPVLVATETLVK